MRATHVFTTTLLLLALSANAETFAPPACPAAPGAPAATTRPHTPRPTTEQIEAVAAAESSDPTVIPAIEPANFGITRYRLKDYYECTASSSSCYWADLDAQTRRAQAELNRLLALHRAFTPEAARKQKLAIVLDIDETALTSYCEEQREDFGYIPSLFETWIVSPEASIPIPGTLRLYKHALASGVSVFFITGRPGPGTPNDQTAATTRNLEAAGYKNWAGLILHGPAYPSHDTITYKSDARASILESGYTLLLNLGDQWSDLREGSDSKAHPRTRAEMNIKLPNPFYYLP